MAPDNALMQQGKDGSLHQLGDARIEELDGLGGAEMARWN